MHLHLDGRDLVNKLVAIARANLAYTQIAMDLEHESEATSLDAKAAEEVLALAIRLQHDRQSRVSIEELNRMAEEVGIDRDLVQEALHKVKNQPVVVEPPLRRTFPVWKKVGLGAVFVALAVNHACATNAIVFNISFGALYTWLSLVLSFSLGLLLKRRSASAAWLMWAWVGALIGDLVICPQQVIAVSLTFLGPCLLLATVEFGASLLGSVTVQSFKSLSKLRLPRSASITRL